MIEPEAADSSIANTSQSASSAVEPTRDELWSVDYLRSIIERRLRILVPGDQISPQRLHRAMGYSLLAPGKRIRPILTLLTAFHFGRRDLSALDVACAIEVIHAASLIMDDLPAMDNAELRRGQPTAHRQFGEDIAILSGIALLNSAYGIVASTSGISDATRIELVRTLSDAVGSNGLVGGQVIDLSVQSGETNRWRIEKLNQLKTGALFVASVETGALVAGVSIETLKTARQFASDLGLAFQIVDDLLDDPCFAGKTGKDTGKDHGKATLVSYLGKGEACSVLNQHLDASRASLERMGNPNSPLVKYAETCFEQMREQAQVQM